MHELRNHTPHPVTVLLADGTALDLPPQPPTPRYAVRRDADGTVETALGTVRLTRTDLVGSVTDVPPPAAGVLRIVARVVVEALPGRPDLVFPDDLVRDADGRVIACRALGRVRCGDEPTPSTG